MSKDDGKIIIFSTFGSEILPYLLQSLNDGGVVVDMIIIDGVISEKDKKIVKERTGKFFVWPDFFDVAKFKIPFFLVDNHNSELCLELVKNNQPELIINGGTPRILKSPILSAPELGVINSHPGLLPNYRGCTCVEWALFNDDEVGATCHFMSEGIDAGPIIYSEAMKIKQGDTYEKVRTAMVFHAIKVLTLGVKEVLQKKLSFKTVSVQTGGNYYKVISEEKLNMVKDKLSKQAYKHYYID